MHFEIGSSNRIEDVAFESSDGQCFNSEIRNLEVRGEVSTSEGVTVQGSFRFSELSGADSGLGRLYAGSGTLIFREVLTAPGEPMDCPPLFERSIRLSAQLQSTR